jgi:hypothetical protein
MAAPSSKGQAESRLLNCSSYDVGDSLKVALELENESTVEIK